MALADGAGLAAGLELLQSVLAHRLQQPKARLTHPVVFAPNEALRHQALQRLHHPQVDVRGSSLEVGWWRGPSSLELGTSNAGHDVDGVKAEAAHEHGEAAQQRLLLGSEQIVAPSDRGAKGLMAGRRVAWAAGQQREATGSGLEPGQQRRRREQAHARRGQLDGQRQTVQPAADAGYSGRALGRERERGVNGTRPLDEQLHCLGRLHGVDLDRLGRSLRLDGRRHAQRRHRELLLSR
ncbi:MAG: hypothetical protein ACRDJN_05820 [Chloroflexota bacterium]